MTTMELIKAAGYHGKLYETVTEDEYILQLHRIPYGKDGPSDKKKIPVFVIHGMNQDSSAWVVQGEKSLAYLLANKNYDVWLGNFRGSTYSAHKKYSRQNPRFWNFSMDEHVKYDLPSMWDFILGKTNKSKIYNIGYSLGVATTLANLAHSDKYSSKLFRFFGMAPVTRITYCSSELRVINIALPLLNVAGKTLLTPIYTGGITSSSCSLNCTDTKLLLNRPSNSTTSLKAVVHGLQLMNSKKFSHFDYGPTRNLIKYHSLSPPVYDLAKVTTPVSLYWSANDPLADPVDVARLQMDLQNVVHHRIVEDVLFDHGDYHGHPEADKYVYNPLIEDMQLIQT